MADSRRRARALLALAVVVALVGALIGIGNTVGRRYLQDRASQAILDRSGLVSEVTISDPMLVWSVARQRFDSVDVVFPALPITAGGKSLTPRIAVSLTDVVAMDGYTRFVAGSATATASLTWSQVSTLAGYTVVQSGTGIQVALTYSLYGLSVSATVDATPAIDAGKLVLRDPHLSVAGVTVPDTITSYLMATVAKPIDLRLPSVLTATAVAVTPDGLQLTATGENVDVTALA